MNDLPVRILQAEQRIRPYLRETPLERSDVLSRATGADVWMKLENLQHTGSFKARGALNKLLTLSAEERNRGIVTASVGNHGAAVAFGMRQLGVTGVIFLPTTVDPGKVRRIESLGGAIEYHGEDSVDTEGHARRYATDRGMTYVPPYNDYDVVAGQGTIGVELARQGPIPDAVFVAVGGGGLIAGVGSYLKALDPAVTMVGCSPDNSKVLIESLRSGQQLDLPSLPTLSDGTAGGVETGTITFPICRDVVQSLATVSESAIAAGMRLMVIEHRLVIEGAAGVTIAALLDQGQRWRGKRVVLVLCGGNVGLDVFRRVLDEKGPDLG